MVDFRNIVAKTNLYNFHSHTQFCDGRADMEDFVIEAISQGFTHLGFSPHSPIPIASPCNMNIDDVPSYLKEIERLKHAYGDKINLYASMEIDFLDDWNASNEYFSTLPLDYRIASVHFIPSFADSSIYVDIDGKYEDFEKKMSLYFNNDIKGVVESFYNQSLKMIEAGGFDVIGHFDKIGHNGSQYYQSLESETWYQSLVRRVFEAIIDNRYIIEVNTKAYTAYNRFFPNERYFKWLKDYDMPILINSDVHYPKLVNSGRMEALSLLGV